MVCSGVSNLQMQISHLRPHSPHSACSLVDIVSPMFSWIVHFLYIRLMNNRKEASRQLTVHSGSALNIV
jgi:hypothetical protein